MRATPHAIGDGLMEQCVLVLIMNFHRIADKRFNISEKPCFYNPNFSKVIAGLFMT